MTSSPLISTDCANACKRWDRARSIPIGGYYWLLKPDLKPGEELIL